MIKADSDRLLKSLVISIMFHAFMFAGMNLLNWFPEAVIIERFAPITLRIEKGSPSSTPPLIEEEIDSSLPKILEPDKVPPVAESREQPPEAVTEDYTPSVIEDDPYKFPPISDDSPIPFTAPFQDEPDVTGVEYVPRESIIEYDVNDFDSTSLNVREKDSSDDIVDTGVTPVISDEKIDNLEATLANSGEQDSSKPIDKIETDRTLYTFKDFPVEFSSTGVNRYLVSEPSISIPSDILSMISSERTVIVGFSLNEDGRLYYLKIKQSSGYPAIDNSIISELRKWEFDRAPGSDDVGGTVTILLKGR